MALYIAIDSSLSMRLTYSSSEESCSRWQFTTELVSKLTQALAKSLLHHEVKLINFSHNSSILMENVTPSSDVISKLNELPVDSSADLLSLFSLMNAEKADQSCQLLIVTDMATFTSEEIAEDDLPQCAVLFAIVADKDGNNVDEEQLARSIAFSVRTHFVGIENFMEIVNRSHHFSHNYENIDDFALAIIKNLTPSVNYTLKCGNFSTRIKLVPSEFNGARDKEIEIVGFVQSNNLLNAPVVDHHFIIRADDVDTGKSSRSDSFLDLLSSSLQIEESVAICRLGAQAYGAISSVKESDSWRLIVSAFPPGLNSIEWIPNFEELTISDENYELSGDLEDLCCEEDTNVKYSYSPVTDVTSWGDAQCMQNDIQKLLRLLKKFPDRANLFYSEINRMNLYACAIGAEDFLLNLAEILEEESATFSSDVIKHCSHVCETIRRNSIKNGPYTIVPPQ